MTRSAAGRHEGGPVGPLPEVGRARFFSGPGDHGAWLARQWERVLDELAGELANELRPIAGQPAAVLAKLTEAWELRWPDEVIGFWVAAARRAGCGWLQVGRRLDMSKQEAMDRFSRWEARFSGQSGPPMGNLPNPVSSFVGREGDRAEVARLMRACRVVTLTGAPGVGKSRLALKVASADAELRAGGAWWVDLAPLGDDDLVADWVARSFSVPEQAGRSVVDALIAYLRTLDLVLVLDNCEHLLDGSASLISAVLRTCPNVSILATSRSAVGVAGEGVWVVPTLSLPTENDPATDLDPAPESDAVELFCQRASAASAGWTLTAERTKAVHEICRQLDGIPLAIELAAARVGSLSPAEIVTCLDDRLNFLVEGHRSSTAHHQRTLEEALDWSHDLLCPEEQAMFRRVSVFAGGFNQATAEAVCRGGTVDAGLTLGLLTRLVNRSLLVADTSGPEARYRMLETMRVYGARQLAAAGEQVTTASRHLGWYSRLVETAEPELTGPGQCRWFSLLAAESEDIYAALGWALSTGRVDTALAMAGALTLFWRIRGRFSEGKRWLESALGADGGVPADRAKALWGAGFLGSMLEDRENAAIALEEAVGLCEDLGDDRLRARCLLILADARRFEGPATALAPAQQSATLAREVGDTWCLGHALAVLGRTQVRMDDIEAGRAALEEAIAIGRRAQDPQSLRLGLLILGGVTLAAGEYQRCEALLHEALDVARQLDEPYSVALALTQLARLAVGRGSWEKARDLLSDGVGRARQSGNAEVIALISCVAGRLSLVEGDSAGANHHFCEALKVEPAGSARAWAIEGLGEAALVVGDVSGAFVHLDAVISGPWTKNTKPIVARALYQLAEVSRDRLDMDEASILHHRALGLRVESGDRAGVPDSLEALAALAARGGRTKHAARLLGAAQSLRDANGYARWPTTESSYAEFAVELRRRLGEPLFRQSWSAGAEMSVARAVACALGSRGAPERPGTGWAALTPSEERVALLAAQGLTNPQIGAELYISRRTARAHLSSIFAKLGITSRKQVAALVPPADTLR
ncbi:MAG: helix-turn-helix transcriptional regulator [Acidimicrobiales bacterium]